ncbi:hypothetical protein LLE49_19395 [Alicyclobacillus tolerans]|uniref:hypothetical protein n=1 Tax=Alicyclobacillus tolerans TaxID=90970 RepID=UPI001F1F320D|nr:hypothetical protein [Alicyclobacillus tolerans]MCF8566887.1 hypothetical protein [Alicyclobacillus tolerans]
MADLETLIREQEHKVDVALRLCHGSPPSVEAVRLAKYNAELAELERLRALQEKLL